MIKYKNKHPIEKINLKTKNQMTKNRKELSMDFMQDC